MSHQRSQFESAVFCDFFEQWMVIPKLTTAYYPQTNMTERVNLTIKCMIASYYAQINNTSLNSDLLHTPINYCPINYRNPMDRVLERKIYPPDAPTFDLLNQLKHLQMEVEERITKSNLRQLRNECWFWRVWVRTFPSYMARTSLKNGKDLVVPTMQ